MTKLIIIRGYPGSGKTTIGKLLEKDGQGIFIDHNAILTFLANIVGDDDGIYDDIHKLELSMARKVLRENKSVIVARGFSTKNSPQPYLDAAKKIGAESIVIRLNVDTTILKERVIAPERREDFNPTINPQALASWIKDNSLEKIDNENFIDASQDIDKVVKDVKELLLS